MSSNSGTIINRSNETAPFLNAIKSRNSKSLPELYSAEVNTEPQAQSRVEVESSSSAGYNRTLRISLPRYGLLNKLYLHTQFGAASFSAAAYAAGPPVVAAAAVEHVPFVGALAYKEIRLMYNGSVLAKLNPHTIIADLWKHSSRLEKAKLQEMLGALDCQTGTTSNYDSATASKYGVKQFQRNIVGSDPHDGINDFYLPLDFFFSSKFSPNRNLDLSVLANEVLLEVDVDSQSNIWKAQGTVTSLPSLNNVKAICYLTEMDIETEKQFRSLQYQAGGSPLTQLAFDTSHVIVATNQSHSSADTVIDVKLNQFVGQVFKLYVYATLTDDFATNKHRLRPVSLKEIQIKATGSNIVNMDNLRDKEDILESYHSGGDYYTVSDTAELSNITCNPKHFYEITFKHPMDFSKVSESGSVAFGQLSVPTLRVVVEDSGGVGGFGAQANPAGGAIDLHVIAYQTALISYSTNTSGSTSIRQIMN